jgi:hypothetical protein
MLFTVIMDFRGGTYVAQVEASSPRKALRTWARNLDPRPIYGLGEKSKQELIADLQEQDAEPLAIDGCRGGWCGTPLVRGKIASINLIATASPSTQDARPDRRRG